MADTSSQSIAVDAPAERVVEVIVDFARYPEWVPNYRSVEVLEEYEDGYASQVRYRIDAGVFADEFVLVYEYSADATYIEWRLREPSKMQKAQNGSYEIVDNGDGTSTVTYTLSVELAIGMIGMFRRKAEKIILEAALKDLKRRAEAHAAAG